VVGSEKINRALCPKENNMIGTVQKFSQLKGFGFLLQDFRTPRFFHVSSWHSDIPPKPGMKVSFELMPSRRPEMPDQATNIVPVESVEKKDEVVGSAQ
jgi:cold shock CspA family protein